MVRRRAAASGWSLEPVDPFDLPASEQAEEMRRRALQLDRILVPLRKRERTMRWRAGGFLAIALAWSINSYVEHVVIAALPAAMFAAMALRANRARKLARRDLSVLEPSPARVLTRGTARK